MMNAEMIAQNARALDLLFQHELYHSQMVFRQNVKAHPCTMTYHNMGAFYLSEGMITSDNFGRNANYLAKHYFEKVFQCKETKLTSLACAHLYMSEKEFETAAHYFEYAVQQEADSITIYNYGVSQYYLKKYQKAVDIFCSLLSEATESKDNLLEEAYAFSLVKIETPETAAILRAFLRTHLQEDPYDRFVLCFLLGEIENARRVLDLLPMWNISAEVFAMAVESCMRTKNELTAKQLAEDRISGLDNLCSHNHKEKMQVKRILENEHYRSALIQGYTFPLKTQQQCLYAGCPIHGTSYAEFARIEEAGA